MSGILYIISAPSGSGKSTLVNKLLEFVPNLEFSISYTTRPPRGSEQDGRQYHFITREQFRQMIGREEFLEYAEVFSNYYGTAKCVLEQAAERGKDLVLDIDVQGERQVKERAPEAVSIFVLPPSSKELESRLRKRSASENVHLEEVIQRRLNAARKEIENYPFYDYILVNDQLEQSIDRLQAIVLGERIKRSGRVPEGKDQEQLQVAESCLKPNMEGTIRSILASFNSSPNGN
ncbi:MAG TPA: guanylate kinase [Candidatus Angelobacter sp.]|nr:guanylate kinase [Candidatus Angelobacter sp.]